MKKFLFFSMALFCVLAMSCTQQPDVGQANQVKQEQITPLANVPCVDTVLMDTTSIDTTITIGYIEYQANPVIIEASESLSVPNYRCTTLASYNDNFNYSATITRNSYRHGPPDFRCNSYTDVYRQA